MYIKGTEWLTKIESLSFNFCNTIGLNVSSKAFPGFSEATNYLCPHLVNKSYQRKLFLSSYLILPVALDPGVYSASNRSEYQKHKNNVSVE
jgi:hypothetical protein